MTSTASSASAVTITPTSLPKGGGAIQGMGESLGAIGPSGLAELSLPLPLSAGRGDAPPLALAYSSGNGNGPFGIGWNLNGLAIRRRTRHGVPRYDKTDAFLGPDGEVLEPERDTTGQIVTTSVAEYKDKKLGVTYMVTRYLPRVEGLFHRIERWQSSARADFWLIHEASGQLHCLGKTSAARIADPLHPQTDIAVWLIEESCSPTCEHLYYQYQSAQDAGISDGVRDTQANRYLTAVHYGNAVATPDLYLWDGDAAPKQQEWLFTLVLDYGQRGVDFETPPPFVAGPGVAAWPVRADPHSDYGYGFEIRTHFLCRQLLMFHHFPKELGADATLVGRLLLEYSDDRIVSRLTAAHRLAYELKTDTLQMLPPLELTYTAFDPVGSGSAWQSFISLPGLEQSPYQFVDLYGEGLPGVLYQVGTHWRYRPPVRDHSQSQDPDAVTYDDWQSLPEAPALQGAHARLMDFSGDGRLDWLVTPPEGPWGYYRLEANRQWSAFTPLTQWPPEYLHPQAMLANLSGHGLSDLAMIGPKSVRLYVNQRTGFGRAQTVTQDDDVALPIRGRDVTELVVFSDVLGSGQSHLVSVRHDRLQCWPNLGHGRFGAPITLSDTLPFDPITFNPRRVFLVDLDGSGAADLVYVDHQHILCFLNQSGNSLSAPITLALPAGITYGQLDQISFADVAGQGTLSVVLSHYGAGPNLPPQHWHYAFAQAKPYLLASMNNNLGAQTQLSYRSSAQAWLDEKHEAPSAIPELPFPVLLVSERTHFDALSGNRLTQFYRYRRGVYDGQEQEFRGFGYVEAQDTQKLTVGPNEASLTPPLLTRSWYHTGRAQDETALYGDSYVDAQAFTVPPTRFTRFDDQTQSDVTLAPSAESAWWLARALKGRLLRQEVYEQSGSAGDTIPYSVSQSRYQVRLVQDALATSKRRSDSTPPLGPAAVAPVVLPLELEQTAYHYERIATDPQISQHVQLQYDAYGALLWSVEIQYPRRLGQDNANPYTDTALPAQSWSSTFDAQQQVLRLQESRHRYHQQNLPQAWVLGLLDQSRQNALESTSDQVPQGGLHLEALIMPNGLLATSQSRIFVAQTVNVYVSGLPAIVKLLDHQETAVLDAQSLTAYPESVLSPEALKKWLEKGGYQPGTYVLSTPRTIDTGALWISQHSYTIYHDAAQFYRPHKQWKTHLSGVTTYTYDGYNCCLLMTEDALKNTVTAQCDYRFLTPWQITDINRNIHEVQFDALGRVIGSTFYGTELVDPTAPSPTTVKVGFKSVLEQPVPADLTVSQAIKDALNKEKTQALATINVYDSSSWMGRLCRTPSAQERGFKVADDLWQRLVDLRFIMPSGEVRSRGWQWAESKQIIQGLPEVLRAALLALPRLPAHSATLTADAYPLKDSPSNAQQQIHLAVTYSDGFGRALQAAMRVPAGLAWQRKFDGELITGPAEQPPALAQAETRWTVTGRIEYDNKGQPVRVYQPYFMNDWRYVIDKALRAGGYADTHYYDALGREIRVVTAQGAERRMSYFPWFTIAEDENDTGVIADSTQESQRHD